MSEPASTVIRWVATDLVCNQPCRSTQPGHPPSVGAKS